MIEVALPGGARRLAEPAVLGAVLAAGYALLVFGVMVLAGPAAGLALGVAGVGALLLLSDARAAVAAPILVAVLFESLDTFAIPIGARFYEQTPVFFTPFELTLLLAVASTLVHVARRDVALLLPSPFAVPLALLVVAGLAGLITGQASGRAGFNEQITYAQTMGPLVVLPLLVVNVVRSREELRRLLGVAGAIAVLKGAVGTAVVLTGAAAARGDALSYYEPASNFVCLIALLAVLAALLARVPTPVWLRLGTFLIVASLVLSLRRTFWLGTTAAILLLLPLASGRVGRRVLVPLGLAVLASGYLLIASGVGAGVQGPVVDRVASIDPSKVKTNTQDRYRLSERRNIVADLKESPLLGIGVGVEWRARYPMPFEYPFGRSYAHTGFLWHWMKAGVLAVIAYFWLLGVTIVAGVSVFRRHPDGPVRVFGAALATGTVGLFIVELASAVVGADARGGAVFGAAIGVLAVAHRQLPWSMPGDARGRIAAR